MRRVRFAAVIVSLGSLACTIAAPAHASTCSKGDFEAVVDEAAGALRDLVGENTPAFQARLRELKAKRKWSDQQFLKEAEPLVRDETIAGFDRKSEDFLVRITTGGQEGASGAGAPDCALLSELRAAMTALVDTQKAKWAYMFDKVEKELRK
jgi:hypothetical protein